MNIQFKDSEQELKDLQDAYNIIGVQEAMFLSHHQLADMSHFDSDQWKKFINHPQVRDYITEEIVLYKDYQIRNMLKKADTLEKSVGAAQWMNALNKADLGASREDGKTFVYMYIPPNQAEENAPNIETMEFDPFALGQED